MSNVAIFCAYFITASRLIVCCFGIFSPPL
nr:MAG TPA_asm: hypothetical protein [Caudoviricetes sp.]